MTIERNGHEARFKLRQWVRFKVDLPDYLPPVVGCGRIKEITLTAGGRVMYTVTDRVYNDGSFGPGLSRHYEHELTEV